MRFAEVVSLWSLTAAPLVGVLFLISIRRRRRALEMLAEPALLARLVTTVRPEWRVLRAVLSLGGVVLIALALARPQWGASLDPVVRRGVDVVLAFDVSTSMLAEDLRPSRLAKAQSEAGMLVETLGGDRVAVVALAGSAAKLCPLTLDHAAARLFIDALDPDLLSEAGTSLSTGLQEVVSVFKPGNRRYRAAVLFSDGEDHSAGLQGAIAQAAEAGVVIHTVGVGTPAGGPIPIRDAKGVVRGYKEDREGRVVTSRLQEAALASIAEETGGIYLPATPGGGEIERIAEAIGSMEQQEMEQRLMGRFEERFQIPLAAALLLLFAEAFVPERRRAPRSRRPLRAAAAGIALILGLSGPALAASAASLMEEGNRHFQEGRYDEALKFYTEAQVEAPEAPEVQLSIGNVLYRKGEFEKAREAYQRALAASQRHLEEDANYNAGTASLAAGDLEKAVGRFREALTLDPGDEDARRNLELALRRMKQEQPPPQPQQQQQQQQEQEQEQDQEEERQEKQKAAAEEQQEENEGRDPQEEERPATAEERKDRREAERILDALRGEDRPRVDPRRQRRPERPPEKDW